MDWDWDDGPPLDTPKGAPRDDPRLPDEPPEDDAPDSPTFADAIEHFDRSAPPSDDDERTQLIKMPLDAGAPTSADPPPPRADLERPSPGAIETVRRGTAASAPAAYSADQRSSYVRPTRPPRDRAAARARRRKQIRRRRLVALAVIVIIVVLIVLLVVRGCGGSTKSPTALIPTTSTAALRAPAAVQPLRVAAATADWRLPAFTGQL